MAPNSVEGATTASLPAHMSLQMQNKQLEETSDAHSFTDGVSAYRAHFSCRYTGKVNAKSKRKITWRFGLCSNAPDGSGRIIREEHQMELIWSINSGKTVLLWNKKDISHFFPSTKSKTPPKVVEYNWQSSSGVVFQIEAHSMPVEGRQQYELFIGGRSFFSLPSASEFLALRRNALKDFVRVTPDKTVKEPRPTLNPEDSEDVSQMTLEEQESFPEVPKDVHQQHDLSSSCTDESEDVLRSDWYSSSLDALRGEMTSAVPELEEMMSRAIVYAYSEDHDSLGSSVVNESFGSFASEEELDPAGTEADALCETYEWMKWTTQHEASNDIYDLKLDFMRGQVEKMVAHARHERLSPHAASSIMIGIAAILNFKLARRMQRSTVILSGMRLDITIKEVYDVLSRFGQIETVCTAMGKHGFAVCHFSTEASADALYRCAKSQMLTLGARFDTFNLYAKPFPWSKPIGGPARVISDASTPRHRRCDLTMTAEHLMDAREELEGVEMYEYVNRDGKRRPSLKLDDLTPFKLDDLMDDKAHRSLTQKQINRKPQPDSLELSASGMSLGPESIKKNSTGTVSTLSTLDGEDVNFGATRIVLK